MFRCNSEDCAARIADENELVYGLSAFGGWFVGTAPQLHKIGVPLSGIQHPASCMCLACAFCPIRCEPAALPVGG